MSLTPRRTLRIPDNQWAAGHAKAQSQGETLTDVLRRLLAAYLVDNAHELNNYGTEYRATPKAAEHHPLTVEGITGRFEDVRRLYPPKHWHLEERTVSPYRPASRRS